MTYPTTLEEWRSYYSDFHKDVTGFRPTCVPSSILECRQAVHNLELHLDNMAEDARLRAELEADGWVITSNTAG